MRLYRCHHSGPLQAGEGIVLSREESSHLARVRRVQAGEPVVVIDGAGREFAARVADPSPKACALLLEQPLRHEPEPPRSPQLALAMTRTSAFDETLERAIELGCAVFRPLESERGVVRLDDKKRAARRERWERLAIERLKQCERLWLPRIAEPLALESLLAALDAEGVVPVALRERSELPTILEVLDRLGTQSPAPSVCFLVGPEGGWTPAEEERLSHDPVVGVSLGTTILRAETAALAALASALAHAGQSAQRSTQ